MSDKTQNSKIPYDATFYPMDILDLKRNLQYLKMGMETMKRNITSDCDDPRHCHAIVNDSLKTIDWMMDGVDRLLEEEKKRRKKMM